MPIYTDSHGDKKDLVAKLVKEGKTNPEICKEANIPAGTLNLCLRRWGLTGLRSQGRSSNTEGETGWDHLRDDVELLVKNGTPYRQISESTGIPDGSIAYLLDKWGFKESLRKNRKSHLTDLGRERMSKAIKASHARGRKHPFKGKVVLRGRFVEPGERLEAVRECAAKDMSYKEMEGELQLSTATIWKVMKDDDILPGHRKGEKSHLWRGGHKKYRGPDWYTNRVLAIKRDSHKCIDCGKTDAQERADLSRGLSVHHIDPYADSEDSSLDNLVTLCQSCHMKREHQNGTFAHQYFGSESKSR